MHPVFVQVDAMRGAAALTIDVQHAAQHRPYHLDCRACGLLPGSSESGRWVRSGIHMLGQRAERRLIEELRHLGRQVVEAIAILLTHLARVDAVDPLAEFVATDSPG